MSAESSVRGPSDARVRSFRHEWGPGLLTLGLVLALGAFWYANREAARVEAGWESRMIGSSGIQARAVNSWVAERVSDVTVIASTSQFRSWARVGDSAALIPFLEVVRDGYGYRAIIVRSGARELMVGEVLGEVRSAFELRDVPSPGDHSWEIVEFDGGVVRVLLQYTPLDLPTASVSLVIDPANGLFPILTDPIFGAQSGETQLVASIRDSVVFFSPGRDYVPQTALVRLPVTTERLAAAAALAGVEGYGRYRSFRDANVFAVTHRDSITGWGLVRKVDVDEVLASVPRARALIALLAALAFATAAMMARAAWNRGIRRDTQERLERQERELIDLRLRSQVVQAEERAGRLARLLDDAGEEIFVLNGETLMVELANRRAAMSLGYDLASLSRRTHFDLAPLLDAKAFHAALADLREGRRSELVFETEHQRRDGTRYPVSISTRFSSAEDPPVFISVVRDMTGQRALEQMLRQAQKMEAVGRLAGGVAHDFNNILTVIQGSSELALAAVGEEDPSREDIEQILDASNRAADLTKQLLAFSRRQIVKPEVASLNEIVRGVQSMLVRLLGEDVELLVELTTERDLVLVDRSQIDQVVMNLAINARDAMPHGGRLSIETALVELSADYAADHPTAEPGPYVMLAVTDTGVGMDEATRQRVFEPFFTTKGPSTGTGLGLSTVYGIVKQSGGNIWVYSEPGHGTTFKAYFPVADGVAVTAPFEPLPIEVAARGSETILVVEDDEAIRRIAIRVLEANGYKVFAAANGEEGLAVVQATSEPIHLVLTDVVMPRMSGRVMAERLAVRRPRIRVLYMSGFTDNAIVHHNVLDAGLDFLQKPFTPLKLLEAVRVVLDRARDRPSG